MDDEIESQSGETKLSRWKRWRRQSWKRRYLGYAIAVFVLIALFYLVENVRGSMALNAAKQRAADAGVELDFVKSMTREMPPREENFATCLLEMELIGDFSDLGPDFSGRIHAVNRGFPAPRGMQYALSSDHGLLFDPPKSSQQGSAEILKLLDQWKSELSEISEASVRPLCVFDVDWSGDPTQIVFPHCLAPSKVFILKASAELGTGATSNALDNIETLQRIRSHYTKNPFLINALAQPAVEQILAQSLWEGLERRQFTEAELSRLSNLCSQIDFVDLWSNANGREIAYGLTILEHTASSPVKRYEYSRLDWAGLSYFSKDPLSGDWDDIAAEFANSTIAISIPYGWFQQSQASTVDRDLVTLSRSKSILEKYNAILSTSADDYYFVWGTNEPYLEGIWIRIIRAIALNELTKTAIAFERYFLKYEKYPAAFSDVVPEFLEAVPIDPWTDKPMLLDFRNDGRPVIYSVGQDLVDDGGIPQSKASNEGDIVWHYSLPAGFDAEKHFAK